MGGATPPSHNLSQVEELLPKASDNMALSNGVSAKDYGRKTQINNKNYSKVKSAFSFSDADRKVKLIAL